MEYPIAFHAASTSLWASYRIFLPADEFCIFPVKYESRERIKKILSYLR